MKLRKGRPTANPFLQTLCIPAEIGRGPDFSGGNKRCGAGSRGKENEAARKLSGFLPQAWPRVEDRIENCGRKIACGIGQRGVAGTNFVPGRGLPFGNDSTAGRLRTAAGPPLPGITPPRRYFPRYLPFGPCYLPATTRSSGLSPIIPHSGPVYLRQTANRPHVSFSSYANPFESGRMVPNLQRDDYAVNRTRSSRNICGGFCPFLIYDFTCTQQLFPFPLLLLTSNRPCPFRS